MDVKRQISNYLDEGKLMQLSTIDENGRPWICNVWFAADEDLNIYWFSSLTRNHSRHLKANNNVAAAVAVPQTPQDKPRGLQVQGQAEELSNEADIARARSVYTDRIFPKDTIDGLMINPEKPHRFYRIKPSKFVLFDTVNSPKDPFQEYRLNGNE